MDNLWSLGFYLFVGFLIFCGLIGGCVGCCYCCIRKGKNKKASNIYFDYDDEDGNKYIKLTYLNESYSKIQDGVFSKIQDGVFSNINDKNKIPLQPTVAISKKLPSFVIPQSTSSSSMSKDLSCDCKHDGTVDGTVDRTVDEKVDRTVDEKVDGTVDGTVDETFDRTLASTLPFPKTKRAFVVTFDGNLTKFCQELGVLTYCALPEDQVIIKISSPGGEAHKYGLAMAFIDALRKKQVYVVGCVDEVAASGGYLIACACNYIISGPWAIIGSIGVVGGNFNFVELMEKIGVKYMNITGGQWKRSITPFTKTTDEALAHEQSLINHAHDMFKQTVQHYRPEVNIGKVSEGDCYFGTDANKLKLVDKIMTSHEYILEQMTTHKVDVYDIAYKKDKESGKKIFHLLLII